jgi:hypothetical protein
MRVADAFSKEEALKVVRVRLRLRHSNQNSFWIAGILFFSAFSLGAEPFWGQHLSKIMDTLSNSSRPQATPSEPQVHKEPRVRSHQEGILEITSTTATPLNVSVLAGVGVVGSLRLSSRRETKARWFFIAENLEPEQNIFDSQGRAVLVRGKVTCQIAYRASLDDSSQTGLTLSVGFDTKTVAGSIKSEVGYEKMVSDFVEEEDFCPLGEVPAFTTKKEIDDRCKSCLGRVLKTLKQDVESRLSHFRYQVNTPLCSKDIQCLGENSDWHVGRCLLTKDPHGSYFTECKARSSIGGACPGKGSRGLFEYPCDKGLACMKIRSATSWFDHNSYECRDPKNWRFKGPARLFKEASLGN